MRATVKIDYKDLSFEELIRLIDDCQTELRIRGSLNRFYIVDARDKRKILRETIHF